MVSNEAGYQQQRTIGLGCCHARAEEEEGMIGDRRGHGPRY